MDVINTINFIKIEFVVQTSAFADTANVLKMKVREQKVSL